MTLFLKRRENQDMHTTAAWRRNQTAAFGVTEEGQQAGAAAGGSTVRELVLPPRRPSPSPSLSPAGTGRSAKTTCEGVSASREAYKLIAKSSCYRRFATAFEDVCSLSLSVIPVGTADSCVCNHGRRGLEFCRLLRQHAAGRIACQKFAEQVKTRASDRKCFHSSICFAGIGVMAVPILSANQHVATLIAGRALQDHRRPPDWRRIAKLLGEPGEHELECLKKAHSSVPVVDGRCAHSAGRLLEFLGKTLEAHIPVWLVSNGHCVPTAIARAKEYVAAHLTESFKLPGVAHHAGLGVGYFCELFKNTTGLTFTQYVARCRTELAKTQIADPARRIAEVAFECGFGSIPTFNRTFKRLAGVAPSKYRLSLRLTSTQAAPGRKL